MTRPTRGPVPPVRPERAGGAAAIPAPGEVARGSAGRGTRLMGGSGGPDGVERVGRLPTVQRDAELARPERQAAYAAHLEALGIRVLLWPYEREGEAAVGALRARLDLRVDPVVPDMRGYLRDASEFGVVGAALRRFGRLGPLDQARIGWHHLARLRRVLRRDFASGVLVMVEMELLRARRYGARAAFLTASVTDLALALDHARLAREFVWLVERTYGLQAGLATYNYGTLVARLRAWGVRPSLIAAPFNPRGYLMNPSPAACEDAVRASEVPVLATHIDVDGLVAPAEALAYLRGLGIRRAAIDLRP